MKKIFLIALLILTLGITACSDTDETTGQNGGTAVAETTPTPTPTPTPIESETEAETYDDTEEREEPEPEDEPEGLYEPEETPEETAEATPEATPEETPEATPEATPEPTPEPSPEATPEPTPEPTPTPAPPVPPATGGFIQGNTFTSPRLGLSFNLPPGWMFIAEDISLDDFDDLDVSEFAMFENLIGDFDVDGAMASLEVAALDIASGMVMLVTIEDMDTPMTPSALLQSTADAMLMIGLGGNFNPHDTVRIGNYDWDLFDANINMFGFSIQIMILLNTDDLTAKNITIISAMGGGSAADILEFFR